MPRSIIGVGKNKVTPVKKTKKKKPSVKTATVMNDGGKRVYLNPRIQCQDCKKVYVVDNFFKNNGDPTGYYRICKKCMFDRCLSGENRELTKEGLTNLLRLINRPYIDSLWKTVKLKDSTGETKLGVYLRTINGNTLKDKFWNDSDAEWAITEEDENLDKAKKYYIDWNGTYTEPEYKVLQNMYNKYKKDFVINDASLEDYTRKICKASLELDQCAEGLRNGSCSEARYKLAKDTFDSLSKSAKFAKNERTEDANLGSFGQIFDLVEKNMWIDDYKPEDDDVYDKLLKQLSNINRSL